MRREDMVLGAFILVPILCLIIPVPLICIKYCTFYDYFV